MVTNHREHILLFFRSGVMAEMKGQTYIYSTMAGFRCIKMLAFPLLALHLTVAVSQVLVVRNGDEASLPCRSVNEAQHVCDRSDWLFLSPGSSNTATLFQLGHVQRNVDRLSVTANCSLVIKNTTAEDVGFYTCRTFYQPGNRQKYKDANVNLFLVNMAKHEDNERVELSCSLRANRDRHITLKWQYDGETVGDDDNMVTQDVSSVAVTFPANGNQKSELFKCYLKDEHTEMVFIFSYPSSGKDATTASTTTTTTRSVDKRSRTNLTAPDFTKPLQLGWWLVVVVGSVALLTVVAVVVVVVVVRYKRTKGEKVQVDDNAADPEEGVSYASISFTKKTDSKVLLPVHDDDAGDAVTYSTLKLSSSSRGVCADPSDVYATINKGVR
ncbi:uncharacterized protein LOC124999276 [Mugil cephalus]|uniref:uncharacterized protein LOC124999276 n=1 Tax=Mugil cephalus TaxID=48193 RepID=UPI001FB67B66|nr:uncharacterized protein LOC124999276 [Mugil cephalus]